MRNKRPRPPGTGALTRRSVRRTATATARPRRSGEPEEPAPGGGGRLRFLRSPTTWLAGVLLAVVSVTFQDVLTSAVKSVLPLDGLPDQLSPHGAVQVVEVRNVKDDGEFLVRGPVPDHFTKTLASGSGWQDDAAVVDVGESEWMITLRGRAAQQVRITDIVPQIVGGSCHAPLGGHLVYAPGQGAVEVIPLDVTIDARRPRLEHWRQDNKGEEPYFTGPTAKQITLNKDESQSFLVHAVAHTGYCRWRYRVHYQLGGVGAEMTLSRPGGKPFEMTAELPDAGDYPAVYVPPFVCGPHREAHGWYTLSGRDFATGMSAGGAPHCPKD
jgi:hypothetical protein